MEDLKMDTFEREPGKSRYWLDDAEVGYAPESVEGEEFRSKLQVEPEQCLVTKAGHCRCRCRCRTEYDKNGNGCLIEDSRSFFDDLNTRRAEAADETKLLKDLEALREDPWVRACPGDLGRLILNRALAVTRGRAKGLEYGCYLDSKNEQFGLAMYYLFADNDSV
jgi:hypothetical protein